MRKYVLACAKKKADFCRPRSNNPQHEYSTCNKCSEKCKNKRKNIQKEMDIISRKKTILESNLNASIPSTSIMPSQMNIDSEQYSILGMITILYKYNNCLSVMGFHLIMLHIDKTSIRAC